MEAVPDWEPEELSVGVGDCVELGLRDAEGLCVWEAVPETDCDALGDALGVPLSELLPVGDAVPDALGVRDCV